MDFCTISYGGLFSEMSHDVLDDNEDLLHQLSAELGLPDFLQERGAPLSYDRGAPTSYERGAPTSSSSSSSVEGMEAGTLMEDQLMQDISCFQTDNALFPEISSADSAYSGSIKSEPSSPFSEVLMGAPSSPSGSEDNSPPLSPNQQPITRQFPINTHTSDSKVSTVLMNADGSYNILTTAPVTGSNIQTIQGTMPVPSSYGGKIAIPKIRKPVPASTHSSSLATPLVLQLGNDGLYYTKTTATGPLIVKTEPTCVTGPPTSYCSPMVAGLPTVTSTHSGEDMRNIKRQQRMIKNRESACISRKKKKEYVTNLEDQITMLSSENMRLAAQNENLKAKVRDLESEKKLWTDSILSSSKGKKVTAMFAVLFMVSINFNSLGSLYNKSHNPGPPSSKFPVHFPRTEDLHDGPGRSLLWVEDNEVDVEDEEGKVEFPANFTGFDKPPPMCPMFFNQSESIRLESELRGWFNVDVPQKQEEKVYRRRPDSTTKPHSGYKGQIKKSKRKDQALGHAIKTPLHSLSGSLYHMLIQEPPGSGKHAIGLYDAPRNTFASFFEAIERRDDTFYVVSFSGDHLLVPATNHSQANRPRMSLLLPALQVSLNESHRGPPGSIAMMKIDCEVMNTQLLHVNQDAIPVHMAANLKTENISGEGDNKREESREYRRDGRQGRSIYDKDVRNKNREEMKHNEKDNVTMEREGGDIPDIELEEFEGLHKIKNLRRKRKPDLK